MGVGVDVFWGRGRKGLGFKVEEVGGYGIVFV